MCLARGGLTNVMEAVAELQLREPACAHLPTFVVADLRGLHRAAVRLHERPGAAGEGWTG